MALAPTLRAASGFDLRSRRVAAGVSQAAIARHAHVARQRVTQWESMYRPPASAIGRYIEALERAVVER
jgi:DNA-binding transcriptional regulator YiaG